jgi:hypothetical protein
MPDLASEARGEARPLTSVPDIGGVVPEPPGAAPTYDPFAAQHGLLLDEREARAIASQAPVLDPEVSPAPSEDGESEVTFSREVPAPPKARRRAVVPKVVSRGRGRLLLAVAALAVVGGGAGAAWFFLGRPHPSPPAVARPPPAAPAPPPAATAQAPAPGMPPAAAPAPPAPGSVAAAAPAPAVAAPAPVVPLAPPAAAARPEAPRKPEHPPRRAPRRERQVAAAPEAAPRPEPERREPPKAEEPKKPAAEARKPEAPSAPPAAPVRTELTSAEVGASIRASARAFDACVAEAARNEPNLQVVGRRMGLYITVNPSGAVTGPHIDDAEVDNSVLGACLKSTARKMVFPAFQGEPFQVRIPMVLGGGK